MLAYIIRSLVHYRRTNLVVMLAVAISTSVIGGALIVGDSVRHTLRWMTEQRLGQITHVLHSPGFFRQQMAEDMSGGNLAPLGGDCSFAPAILITGSVEAKKENDRIRRAGNVSLLGLDATGWQMLNNDGQAAPAENELILGYRTANEIGASPGDEVSLWIEVPSSIPRDSLLGERDEVTIEIVLNVTRVLPEDVGASRFDLNPGQQLPYNAFLNLGLLQERLGIEEIEVSRRNPVASPAKINAVLASCGDKEFTQKQADDFQRLVQESITLTDLEMRIRTVEEDGFLSVETERMILQDALADAVLQSASKLGFASAETTVYLSNEIYAVDRTDPDERYSMYSIIAGLPFEAAPPLGSIRLAEDIVLPPAVSGEASGDYEDIYLSAWLAEDLQVSRGDIVEVKWHEVGSHGELPEIVHQFHVAGVLPEDDPVTLSSGLTPVVKGVTDVESFSDIDQPFEMELDRLTPRDDAWWDAYRATPKAFVTLSVAEKLWRSRYGKDTSIRVANGENVDSDGLSLMADRLSMEIPQQLNPTAVGMVFRPVLHEGLQAAVGANDFTVLFLGFSFFLILSAIILASLMFRLGIQRRISQLGVLNAVGWPARRAERFFILEGLLVCLAGTIPGALAAIGFAKLMIFGLTNWWAGATGTDLLLLQVRPSQLVIAGAITLFLSAIVIIGALRSFRVLSIRQQLSGDASEATHDQPVRFAALRKWMAPGCLVVAIALPSAVVAGVVPGTEAFGGLSWPMVCFFLAGFCSLAGGLSVLGAALRRRNASDRISGSVMSGLTALSLANAARSPLRTMLTTALIASATFVIVAVAAGRRNPLTETPDFDSGNGGFRLLAESSQPVLFDLSTPDGRERLNLSGDNQLPEDADIYSFSMKPGADASCVNLYQTRIPTILGASDRFIERGGFRFADTPDERWKLLSHSFPAAEDNIPVIPVIGDMNTLMYSLKKGMGAQIMYPNEDDPEFALEVVGMLDGSVFQGVLIMTDENLKRLDQEVAGARWFLAATDSKESMTETATALETGLNDYGMDTEPVNERLEGFLAVQNTYLSTFQILGGLGLLVGTFGLAAVMMRNVEERRREIALLKAVGFTERRVSRLILSENCMLLVWGILLGTGSALLAMMPHLQSTGADLPWQNLELTLLTIVLIGSLASGFAVRAAGRMSIRDNLAAE